MNKPDGEGPVKPQQPQFTKQQFLASAEFQRQKDAVSALLQEGKLYTKKQAEAALRGYLERKV